MANRVPTSGTLVPVTGPSGDVQWQTWTYGELTQHLNIDLQVDATALDIGSVKNALRLDGTAWKLITPGGGWANSANPPTVAYYVDSFNVIHWRGRMTVGTTATQPFAVPAGLRPHSPGVDLYALGGWNGAAAATPAFWAVDGSNGNAPIYFGAGTAEVSLGGVTWLIEN